MDSYGYSHPEAVFFAGDSGVKVDPYDPAFKFAPAEDADPSLPAIYLFSNSRNGDGTAYAMAEDGTVINSHFCSHWGYMRHDLHDRSDARERCEAHYPNGYRIIVLLDAGQVPPPEVLALNRVQAALHAQTEVPS